MLRGISGRLNFGNRLLRSRDLKGAVNSPATYRHRQEPTTNQKNTAKQF